jgi:hypothetical protein
MQGFLSHEYEMKRYEEEQKKKRQAGAMNIE